MKKKVLLKHAEKEILRGIKLAGYKFAIEYFWDEDDMPIVCCGAHTEIEAQSQIKTQQEIFTWIVKANIVRL